MNRMTALVKEKKVNDAIDDDVREENGTSDAPQQNAAQNGGEKNDTDDLSGADLGPLGYLRRVIQLEVIEEGKREGGGFLYDDELAHLWVYVDRALETGDLSTLRRLKNAFDEMPTAAPTDPQPWNKGPEPTREELLEESAHMEVCRFLNVVGGDYPRSYGRQLFEPPYLHAGQIVHDFGAYVDRYPVQVNIHEHTDRDIAVSILRAMATWIEVNWKELIAGKRLNTVPYGRWLVTEEDVRHDEHDEEGEW